MSGDPNIAEVAERLLGMELRQPPKVEAAAATAAAETETDTAPVETASVAAAGEEPAEKAALADDALEKEHRDDEAGPVKEEAGGEMKANDDEEEGNVRTDDEDKETAKEAAVANKDADADEEQEEEEDDEEEAELANEPDDLDELIEELVSGTRRARFVAVQGLRRRVSDRYEAPAYARLLTSPALAAMVSAIDNDADPELQFESAWALTNLLAGSGARPTDLVASCGLARPLIRLLLSGTTDRLREQACWALANIAGESAAWRDQLLSGGDLLAALDTLWDSDPNNGLLDASSLLLVNLFRDRNPRIRFEAAQRLLPRTVRLLRHPFEAAVPHVVWAASYAIEDCEPRARLLLREPDAVDCLAGFLDSGDDALLVPTLRLFCNLAACMNPMPVDQLAAAGVFASIGRLLIHEDTKLRRQALLFFGSVSSGPETQLEAAAQAGCLAGVSGILTGQVAAASFVERRESFWILPNFLLSRGHRFTKRVIDESLDGFLEALTFEESEVTRCVLLCLRHLLFTARYKRRCDLDYEALKRSIEANDGVKKIELAQRTDDKELVKLSYQLVDQFFWGNERKYMAGEEADEEPAVGGAAAAASPAAAAAGAVASASPEGLGDDDRERRDSEAEPQPQPDKDALSSLIGGLQARD